MRATTVFCCLLLAVSCSANQGPVVQSQIPPPYSPLTDGKQTNSLAAEAPPLPQQQQAPLVKPPSTTRGGASCPVSRLSLIAVGCLLAANSGFLNGLALSGNLIGKKQAVAAVTGAWTTSALAANGGDSSVLATQVKVMASYFIGSMINGFLNPGGIDWSTPGTHASLLVSAVFVLGGFLFSTGDTSMLFWCLLALANGVQNSWTSSLIQGNILRTAHFSGITSDMGTFTGQIFGGNGANAWKLRIFAALAASFWLGGYLSVPAAKQMDVKSLWISIVLYLGLWSFFVSKPVISVKPLVSG